MAAAGLSGSNWLTIGCDARKNSTGTASSQPSAFHACRCHRRGRYSASVPKARLATIRNAARYPHCGHVNRYMSMTIQSGVRIEKHQRPAERARRLAQHGAAGSGMSDGMDGEDRESG